QRLGFRRAIVFSSTPEIIGAELAKRSWARQQIAAQLVPTAAKLVTARRILEQGHTAHFLIVPANVYCDGRLLATLSARNSPTVLVDSNPPQFVQHLIQNPSGPTLVTRDFLLACSDSAPVFEELKQKTDAGQIETAIVALLCKTRITPNQVTIAGFMIGCGATTAFALGRVGVGLFAALAFGIVDGLDGKLSRVKVETTERGKWEHHLDYLIENS